MSRKFASATAAVAAGLGLLLFPSAGAASVAGGTINHPVPTAGCDLEPPVVPGQTTDQTLESGGYTRHYLLHLPDDYTPDEPLPLVLAFHGRHGTGYDIESFSGIDTLDAVAVYPIGLPGDKNETAWEGAPYSPAADDVLFVSDLLTELQQRLCIDPLRIYATGKSNGAGFVGLLACELPGRIAAFAAVSGAFYPTGRPCQPRLPVPIMEFHGTGDTVVNYDGEPDKGLPAIPDWMAGWARRDHCDAQPDTIFDQDDVTGLEWGDCAGHAQVIHYRIDGANHTWPGALSKSGPGTVTHTISATEIMWDFFNEHPLHRCQNA